VPAATQFTIEFAAQQERAAVPYELVRGVVMFKALVNGREVWAMLDNRATTSLIDATFARSLGLELIPDAARVNAPTGSLERWHVREVDLSIPGQARTRAPATATDLAPLSTAAGQSISLIVGKEYFDGLVFLFTPHDRHFQLGPSGSLTLPATTPFVVLQNSRPQIEVLVAGQPTVLTVDLGYNGDIALSQDAWDRLGMGALPTVPNQSVYIDGAVVEGAVTTIEEVSLGPARVGRVKVAVLPAVPDDRDGLVGFGLLSRLIFAIDVKAQRLWLIAPAPQP
jgi:predicted aspartyl protease